MIERINLQSSDQMEIIGDHYKCPKGSPGVLLLHAMPADRKSWVNFAKKIQAAGMSVLAIDLRGHGESTDGPTGYKNFSDTEHQKSIEDVKAAIKYQKNEGYQPMFITGASIGANLALQALVESDDIKKIILLSPGLNYRGLKTLPLAKMVKNNKAVYAVSTRDDDRVIQASQMVQEIYNALNCEKEIEIFENGGHGTDILNAHPEFMNELIEWLNR